MFGMEQLRSNVKAMQVHQFIAIRVKLLYDYSKGSDRMAHCVDMLVIRSFLQCISELSGVV
jgi:hypothetical protein